MNLTQGGYIVNQSILIRKSNTTKYVLDEGVHNGKIFSVEVKKFDSIYHDSGKRVALNTKVEFVKTNGEFIYLYYAPTITWSEKGKFMKNASRLRCCSSGR